MRVDGERVVNDGNDDNRVGGVRRLRAGKTVQWEKLSEMGKSPFFEGVGRWVCRLDLNFKSPPVLSQFPITSSHKLPISLVLLLISPTTPLITTYISS
jgi:hypothetical protein